MDCIAERFAAPGGRSYAVRKALLELFTRNQRELSSPVAVVLVGDSFARERSYRASPAMLSRLGLAEQLADATLSPDANLSRAAEPH